MDTFRQGSTLNDRYILESEIGHGGMGKVFLARDQILQRNVAIKVLSNAEWGTEGRARLLHEAQAIAKLNHPNIVTVHDAGEINEIPFIVMELIEGKNLNEAGFHEISETLPILRQVCTALNHAHAHGIIHRDLKPENILITEDGIVKLMDFGLARSIASRQTAEGTILGTVFYLAPELALGKDFDGRADLYALGVMLYELTTGELPFTGKDPVSVISQHLHAPIVPPRAKNEDIPPLFEQLILKLLSKDPEARPASPEDVLEILESPNLLDPQTSLETETIALERIAHGHLVGREKEMEGARNLWSRTLIGEGQLLLISGEPGIGKTRLLKEMTTHVEVSGGLVLVGEAHFGGSAPYDAIRQIVHKALEDSSAERIEISEFVLADLLTLVPEFMTIFPDIPSPPTLDPESEQRRMMENLAIFINTLAEKTPILLAIDDAHWADSGTLAMMQHLVRRCRRSRVMVLITYREVELDEALPFHEIMLAMSRETSPTRVKLSRFTIDQTKNLLATIFAEEITPEFLTAIHRETEGNPFFIEEVSKSLVESGKVYFEGGRWHRPEIRDLEIPQSIRIAIQARVGRLPENNQEILRLAALLGREFAFDILVEASGEAEDTLIPIMESAEKSQLIQEIPGYRHITFQFTHALFASTLVESIRTLRRRKMHKKIADALTRVRPTDFENLALHYGEAGSDEEALLYYTKAGDRASTAFANQEAEEFYLTALDLAEAHHEKASLLTRLGIVQDRLGSHDTAIETWRKGIDLFHALGEEDHAAELYARCGRVSWELGDTPGNLAFCLEGLNLMDNTSEGPGVAKLLAETGRAYYFNNELDEVEDYCRRALEIAEKYDAIDVQADALITLGLIPTLPPEEAIAYYEKAIEITEAAGYWEQAARAHNNISIRLSYLLGDIQKSREHLLQAAEHARKIGAISHELFYRSSAVGWLIRTGDLDLVEASLPDLYKLMEAAPDSQYAIALMRVMEANLYRHRGELEKATRTLREILVEAKSAGDPQAISGTSILLIDALIEMGNLEEAKALTMELIPMSDSGSFYGAVTPRSYLATIFAQEGDFDNAHKVLEEASIILRNTASRAIEELYMLISEARVAIRQKQWNIGWEKAEKLKLLFEKYAFRWNRAILLLEWSQACLTRSRNEDLIRAQEMLQDAISEFKEMGAIPYMDQCQSLLEEVQTRLS